MCTDLRGFIAHHYEEAARRPKQCELSIIGTTADIMACKEEDSEWYHGPRFIVKLMGRQRFQLMEIYKRMNGYVIRVCNTGLLYE